jgi:hypothetical protein
MRYDARILAISAIYPFFVVLRQMADSCRVCWFQSFKRFREKAMYAMEFQAKIKDGTIEIPEIYRNRFKDRVRVILLAEAESATETFIDQLLQHPLKVAGFKPLTREAMYERP